MAEFKSNTFWLRSSFLLIHLAFGNFLILFTAKGWGTVGPGLVKCDGKTCGNAWYTPTEAFMVVGYLSLLVGVVLCQCVVLLDEVAKIKKGLSYAWTILAFLSGFAIFFGDVAYLVELPNSAPIPNAWTVLVAFVCIASGVCVALDLAGVKTPKFLSK